LFSYIFLNIFKFYQLGFIYIFKFNECFAYHEILFGILILNVYNYNLFLNIYIKKITLLLKLNI